MDEELAKITEEIRITAITDLLALVRALREVRKVLRNNEAIELLLEDDYRKEKFLESYERCLSELWHVIQALEKPKKLPEKKAAPPEKNLWA